LNWYLAVLKNYAGFSGRASRKEYWMFALFNIIFFIVASFLNHFIRTDNEVSVFALFYTLYVLAILIPSLAVSVRRLHDIGKSGWMILISLIPTIGAIWLLVLMITDSDPEENQYGPKPKESYSVDSVNKDTQLSSTSNNSSTGDTIILIAVIWIVFFRLFLYEFQNLPDNLSIELIRAVFLVMGLIWAFVPIGLAFAIKNKSKRVVLFIIGGLYLLYGIYKTIIQFIDLYCK